MKLLIAVIILGISETLACTLLAAGNWPACLTVLLIGIIAVRYIKVKQS